MKIFFFCNPPGDPDDTHDYHPAVCIAEGLRELGVTAWSNINHWPDRSTGEFLFRHDPAVEAAECDAVVISQDWFERRLPLPAALTERNGRALIYLDKQDGSRIFSLERSFPRFDRVLRASYQKNARYPSNFRPWAFGIAQRFLEDTAQQQPISARSNTLLVSHRNMRYPHSLRLFADRNLVPKFARYMSVNRFVEPLGDSPPDPSSALLWHLTGRRYSRTYYEALSKAAACYAFGGYFVVPWLRSQNSLAARVAKRIVGKLQIPTRQLNQWDSYRLWESFAAGCVTIHLDLAKYGCVLPDMPQNWVHYAGIDLDAVDASLQRFADRDAMQKIGENGRAWAIRHYGPRAVAQRFLGEIEAVKGVQLESVNRGSAV
jgi:hypothetical protein